MSVAAWVTKPSGQRQKYGQDRDEEETRLVFRRVVACRFDEFVRVTAGGGRHGRSPSQQW